MTARPLLPDQPVTAKGELPSRDLVEIIQRLVLAVGAVDAKLAAIAAVASPAGGGTVDAQARTAIDAIRAAAT